MTPWWEIHYFERTQGLSKINSAMVPFKLLPELDRMDIRNGHKFKTDQFEIEIPGSGILLHMASRSMWIDGKPHYVEKARRVILFQRTKVDPANGDVVSQHIYLGLMTDEGRGLIVNYHVETNSWELKIHPNGNSPDKHAEIQSLPALPDLEN
jgi:hypothetical protein